MGQHDFHASVIFALDYPNLSRSSEESHTSDVPDEVEEAMKTDDEVCDFYNNACRSLLGLQELPVCYVIPLRALGSVFAKSQGGQGVRKITSNARYPTGVSNRENNALNHHLISQVPKERNVFSSVLSQIYSLLSHRALKPDGDDFEQLLSQLDLERKDTLVENIIDCMVGKGENG